MLLLLLIACPDDPPEPFDYEEGTYIFELSGWTGGDCDFESVTLNADAAEAEVIRTSGEDFEAVFPNGIPLVCGVAGQVIACEAEEPITTLLAGFSATVTTTWTVVGEWETETSMAGSFRHDFDCEGDGCGDLSGSNYGGTAEFPCVLSGTWSASK